MKSIESKTKKRSAYNNTKNDITKDMGKTPTYVEERKMTQLPTKKNNLSDRINKFKKECRTYKDNMNKINSGKQEHVVKLSSKFSSNNNFIEELKKYQDIENFLNHLHIYIDDNNYKNLVGNDSKNFDCGPNHILFPNTDQNKYIKKHYCYTSLKNNGVTKENILNFFKNNYNKIIIIGNGGAGAMGMIQHFANSNNPFFKDKILIWHFGNSNENMLLSHFLHIGITYEPNIEKLYIKKEIEKYNADKEKVNKSHSTIFINKLAIYVPRRDKLGFRNTFETNKIMFNTKKWNSHEQIFFCLFDKAITEFLDVNKKKNISQKYKEAYVSRYDHSAIGEHDRMMLVLGSMKYIDYLSKEKLHMYELLKINLGFGIDSKSSRKNIKTRFIRLISNFFILKNQSWYPPSILEFSRNENRYHLNDLSFISDTPNTFTEVLIDNPAQIWIHPYHINKNNNLYVDCVQNIKDVLNKDYITINQNLGSENVHAITTINVKHGASAFIKLQEKIQNFNPKMFIQDWIYLNNKDVLFAHIEKDNVTDKNVIDFYTENYHIPIETQMKIICENNFKDNILDDNFIDENDKVEFYNNLQQIIRRFVDKKREYILNEIDLVDNEKLKSFAENYCRDKLGNDIGTLLLNQKLVIKLDEQYIFSNKNNYEILKKEFREIQLHKYEQDKPFPKQEEFSKLSNVDQIKAFIHR